MSANWGIGNGCGKCSTGVGKRFTARSAWTSALWLLRSPSAGIYSVFTASSCTLRNVHCLRFSSEFCCLPRLQGVHCWDLAQALPVPSWPRPHSFRPNFTQSKVSDRPEYLRLRDLDRRPKFLANYPDADEGGPFHLRSRARWAAIITEKHRENGSNLQLPGIGHQNLLRPHRKDQVNHGQQIAARETAGKLTLKIRHNPANNGEHRVRQTAVGLLPGTKR